VLKVTDFHYAIDRFSDATGPTHSARIHPETRTVVAAGHRPVPESWTMPERQPSKRVSDRAVNNRWPTAT
jgi:hypothetical protein